MTTISTCCAPVDWPRIASTWRARPEVVINKLVASLDALYRIVRPLLFHLDPELSHRVIFRTLSVLQGQLERRPPAPPDTSGLCQRICGLDFPAPIGLAAGFDKNAELPHIWHALGFGFAELGTLTAKPQPGNPRPRMFRLVRDQALINRLGFNNLGAAAVAARLQQRFARGRPPIPYGINIGKSRVIPIEEATADYVESFRTAFPLADYVAVNVSSPNTPGLRDLQSATQLQPLLAALNHENQRLAAASGIAARPLFLKIAPDVTSTDLRELVDVAVACGIAGLIATNTTIERPNLRSPARLQSEAGGLSGVPLRERSTAVLRELFAFTRGHIPLIGVGGVFTGDDAYAKVRGGASLVQVYTGFIYEGPALPQTLHLGLRAALARDGYLHLSDAVAGASRSA